MWSPAGFRAALQWTVPPVLFLVLTPDLLIRKVRSMDTVAVAEFPFVADMPKSEVRKVRTLWQELRAMAEIAAQNGMLIPPAAAAELLGITPQRVSQLMDAGRLRVWHFRNRPYVCGDDVTKLAETPRPHGIHLPRTYKEAFKRSVQGARNSVSSPK